MTDLFRTLVSGGINVVLFLAGILSLVFPIAGPTGRGSVAF